MLQEEVLGQPLQQQGWRSSQSEVKPLGSKKQGDVDESSTLFEVTSSAGRDLLAAIAAALLLMFGRSSSSSLPSSSSLLLSLCLFAACIRAKGELKKQIIIFLLYSRMYLLYFVSIFLDLLL